MRHAWLAVAIVAGGVATPAFAQGALVTTVDEALISRLVTSVSGLTVTSSSKPTDFMRQMRLRTSGGVEVRLHGMDGELVGPEANRTERCSTLFITAYLPQKGRAAADESALRINNEFGFLKAIPDDTEVSVGRWVRLAGGISQVNLQMEIADFADAIDRVKELYGN